MKCCHPVLCCVSTGVQGETPGQKRRPRGAKRRRHESRQNGIHLEKRTPRRGVAKIEDTDRRNTKMEIRELEANETEKVSGGNFFADLEDVLRNIFQEPAKPTKPDNQTPQEPKTGRGKC